MANKGRKLVFNIIENFVNVKSANMFSTSVVSSVLCLLKFLRGSRNGEQDDSFESKQHEQVDETHSETESLLSDQSPEHELCEPTLNVLSQISKRLSSIYIQPSSSIFHGSYSILLVSMTESQGQGVGRYMVAKF